MENVKRTAIIFPLKNTVYFIQVNKYKWSMDILEL